MAKFDHNRPFGQILPPMNRGCYWQAPHTFDQDYNHINPANGEILEYAEGEKAPPLKTKETPAQKKERQDAETKARQGNPNTAKAPAEKPANVMGEKAVSLRDWADGKGEKGIPFFQIKKQMEDEGYDQVPVSAVAAREMIKARN